LTARAQVVHISRTARTALLETGRMTASGADFGASKSM
jgi:hypothetical protein